MSTQPSATPLAIVGIGCLFPKADGLSAFWSNLRNGVDAIGPVPPTHWRPEEYFDADPKSPDMTYARRGGFLPPVDFNPLEFGISPNVLEATDATQLLGLVVAQRALRDAGLLDEGKVFDRNRTSVVLGVTGTLQLVIPLGARLGHPIWRKALREAGVDPQTAEDVVQRIADGYVPWQENSFPGLLGNVAAGRIANRLDLGGTNCVVDAACASSLSALHLAALELESGRSDAAVTGGFDTFNDIFMYMCFSKTPALSPTGDARPFDAAADGTILGEGLGAVVLKRLADARRDGDRVYAVIKGLGTSSDGKGNAIYAPSASGQAKALRRAYDNAGVTPDTIELVEAHGTGTKVGDATEVSALTAVYREVRSQGTWCALGSVKSQIGHTKAAAGVAGLIKAALALHHKVLPPTIKVTQPHGTLAAEGADAPPFYVNTQARPWLPRDAHPRRAGVSAFGFGGSNFHCVLEEAGPAKAAVAWDGDVQLVACSGASAAELAAALTSFPAASDWAALRSFAAAARARFSPAASCRLAFVVERERTDAAQLVAGVRRLLAERPGPGAWSTPDGAFFRNGATAGALAFLFPGQGSQYVGMLRDLACTFPAVFETLARADAAFSGGRRLTDFVYPHPAFTDAARSRQDDELRDTAVAQPAIGAVSLGALRLLEEFGVRPQMTAGHSYGELTALCAAGAFDETAFHVLSGVRGRLMAAGGGDRGSMLAVQGSLAEVEAFLAAEKLDLVLANRNAPRQGVLSGATAEIERAEKALEARGMRCRRLPVAAAFHSRFVADARAPFAKALAQTEVQAPRIPVYANVNAATYPGDPARVRTLLADQLAQPVEFVREIAHLHAAGARTFVEVGPGDRLTGLVKAILEGKEHEAFALDAGSGSRSGLAGLARTLAQLAALGHAVDLAKWDAGFVAPERGKAGLTVTLTGVNYVKPRTPRPARTATVPMAGTNGNGVKTTSAPANGTHSAAAAATAPAHTPTAPAPAPSAPAPATTAPAPAAFAGALHTTHESIQTLQRMQGQTADLHRKFLEGQEAAQLAVLRLVEQQQALLHAQLGIGVPPVAPAPAGMTIPQAPASPAPAPVLAAAVAPAPSAAHAPAALAVASAAPVTTAAASVGPSAEVVRTLLAVVADKTGYPVDMLQLDMGLDTDLGIDSIKRVEILSALQERLPNAPPARPEDLGRFHTLRQIAEFLAPAHGPAATDPGVPTANPVVRENVAVPTTRSTVVATDVVTPATAKAPATSGPAPDVVRVLLEIVAEKTGYPADMLQLDMGLDADLGIDSIKRVEILSALQERLPDAPPARPEDLGRFHTLRQIAEFLSVSTSPGTVPAPAVAPAVPVAVTPAAGASADVVRCLLEIVAEKTGYPADMLQLDMGLDADLGIDSIKRVEILSALQERLPDAPAAKPEDLGRFHTLRQIAEFLSSGAPTPVASMPAAASPAVAATPLAAPANAAPPAAPAAAAPSPSTVAPVPTHGAVSRSPSGARLERLVVVARPLEADRPALALPPGATFWITDDGSPLSSRLTAALRTRGLDAQVIHADLAALPAAPATLRGLILLAPAHGDADGFLRTALRLSQIAGPALRAAARTGPALFATVSALDGAFGLAPRSGAADPAQGGLAGLAKTVAREWTELTVKALDLAPDFRAGAADDLAREFLTEGPIEVGLSERGAITLDTDAVPLAGRNGHPGLAPGELVVVTGGARGVTAEIAVALARTWRPTLLLLGRSPEPAAEPEWLPSLADEAALKQAIAAHLGAGATPRAVGDEFRRRMANRAVLRTLERVRAAGATVLYRSADVRDPAALRAAVDAARRAHGPVRGVVHGAGVLADRRIEDKTLEQLDDVFATKIAGLRGLLAATGDDDLRFLVLFSSSTGRYGRVGQVDYAIANEVLNKTAQREQRRRPGCRVVSLNWGPWDGGMVTPALARVFEQEGVGLIPLEAGAAHLVGEIALPPGGDVEIVVLGCRPALPPSPPGRDARDAGEPAGVALSVDLAVERFPFLRSHVIDGKAVLPVAMMVEWLAHAALHDHPGLAFRGLDEFAVTKGVVLDGGGACALRVLTAPAETRDGLVRVPVALRSERVRGGDFLHARAVAVLGGSFAPEAPSIRGLALAPFPASPAECYASGRLFHGPDLHGIVAVEGCAPEGIAAFAQTAPAPAEWIRRPWRGSWLADPLALDVAFQLMILWSQEAQGVGSLPTAFAEYRQFRRAFPRDGVRVIARITSRSAHAATADLEFVDGEGVLVARIRGFQGVLDASLDRAFRRNRLAEEMVSGS